jgi:hypothetical protein
VIEGGRTASKSERRVAADANAALTASSSGARVAVKATKPGAPSRFEIRGLTEDEARLALKALGVKLTTSREG